MELSDVIAEYPYCTFCGRGVRRDLAFYNADGEMFHSRECHDFSLRYPALVRRLDPNGVARPLETESKEG